MRILFDGYWWTEGPRANRTVQRELILAWHETFPEDELIVAVRGSRISEVDALPQGIRAVRTKLWPQAASNALELSAISQRVAADWVIAHNYTPLWGTARATFIHDFIFQEHPRWFSKAERLYFSFMPPMAVRSRVVATSSETEGNRIRRLNPKLTSVHAIGLAVATRLATAEPARPAFAAGVREFALTVGRLNSRKNLGSVIEGAVASSSICPERPLLIVGDQRHSGSGVHLSETARGALECRAARFVGPATDQELVWLFSNAALVVNLSMDEGFGLPPLEAAYFNAPLLLSDIPVLRETVGDVAHFVPVLAPASLIGRRIDESWGQAADDGRYEALRRRYTWANAVRSYRDLLAVDAARDGSATPRVLVPRALAEPRVLRTRAGTPPTRVKGGTS